MTIQQLQDFINTKPDIRQLINVMADFLQANPVGGSALPDDTGLTGNYYLQSNGAGSFWQNITTSLETILTNNENANGKNIQNLGALTFQSPSNYIRMFTPNGTPVIIRVENDFTLSVTDDS